MIFFDTETTGLIDNEALPLDRQPEIIELGAVKVGRDGEVQGHYSQLLRPKKLPLPDIITKISGITDSALAHQPTFAEAVRGFADFVRGEEEWIAHNARFDQVMLIVELRRIGKEFSFPYPSVWTDSLTRYPGKLSAWAKKVKGASFTAQAHRAVDDCLLLRECWFAGEENDS